MQPLQNRCPDGGIYTAARDLTAVRSYTYASVDVGNEFMKPCPKPLVHEGIKPKARPNKNGVASQLTEPRISHKGNKLQNPEC